MLKNKKSFTLIELLVVIAIIAVLAAVSIPVVIGVVQRAQDSAITADIRSIHMEAVRIHLDTGNFNTIHCTAIAAGSPAGTVIDPDIAAMCAAIDRANGLPDGTPLGGAGGNVTSHVATAPAQHFCIQSPLHGGGFRCADHTGHWALPAGYCGNATGTGTITEATAATGAQDLSLNIDGIAITLAPGATLDAVATTIRSAINASAVRTIDVTGTGATLIFTNRTTGTAGLIPMTDGAYRTEVNGRLGTVPSITTSAATPAFRCR